MVTASSCCCHVLGSEQGDIGLRRHTVEKINTFYIQKIRCLQNYFIVYICLALLETNVAGLITILFYF